MAHTEECLTHPTRRIYVKDTAGIMRGIAYCCMNCGSMVITKEGREILQTILSIDELKSSIPITQ